MADAHVRRLERRFLVLGDLELRTALHVGGGDTALGATDSPVVRRPDGEPFIPGSSIKGAFRSAVEKLAASLTLPYSEIDVIDQSNQWNKDFRAEMDTLRRRADFNEEQVVEAVNTRWPAAARLFGTPFTNARIAFSDAYLRESAAAVVQRRDGVAIDRDSERARDGMLYNYEVVPTSLRFSFELSLENPDNTELALACLGLAELRGDFFSLGGKRSSGLGRCKLVNERLYQLDLTGSVAERAQQLRRYLTKHTAEEKYSEVQNIDAFIQQHIDQILPEVPNA